MQKPVFNADQLVNASDAAKRFGDLRKKAKISPQFVLDNGSIETVVIDYELYEQMYSRIMELEEREETQILSERLERLETNPEIGIPWKAIRRSKQSE